MKPPYPIKGQIIKTVLQVPHKNSKFIFQECGNNKLRATVLISFVPSLSQNDSMLDVTTRSLFADTREKQYSSQGRNRHDNMLDTTTRSLLKGTRQKHMTL